MSDKRTISEVSTPTSDHLDKKIHTKPGRKLIETEPKSKRTAQNRAAQRAYRERKERKMLELEEKVSSLEDANIRATTESDFLRAQVEMLKNELTRYRGHGDFSDLNLPTKVGHLSGYDTQSPGTVKREPASDFRTADSSSSANSISSESPDGSKQLFSRFPWSKDNLNDLQSSTSTVNHSNSNNSKNQQQLPDLITGGSSSSTSPLNDNILVSPESQTSADSNPSIDHTNNFAFANNFDEQVEPFCVKLNEACGTKECPVPKFKRHDSTTTSDAGRFAKINTQSKAEDSPFANLFSNDTHKYNNIDDPFFNNNSGFNYDFSLNGGDQASNDPLSFLNDNTFDVSLAFADNLDASGGFSGSPVNEILNGKAPEQDPVAQLTTEESAYDAYNDEVNTNFNFNEFVKSSLPSDYSSRSNSVNDPKSATSSHTSVSSAMSPAAARGKPAPHSYGNQEDDEDEVVPAPQDTVRCSEIWDRITSHPKYTEIDIDGLCSELKSKAKCSERGVVLNSSDVNKLLEQSAYAKKK